MGQHIAPRAALFFWIVRKDGGVASCEWSSLRLMAYCNGQWTVREGKKLLASDKDQTPGTDLMDAQRRAQAAAMVLNSLRIQSQS